MPKVAIIGSCITRDLWPIRGETAELLYVSRTSLPSLMAPPLRAETRFYVLTNDGHLRAWGLPA